MTKINGGGPQFSGPSGVNGPNHKQLGQGAAPAGLPGLNAGPSLDTVSFSGIPTGNPASGHNVNFNAISKMSLNQAQGQLHPTTFGALTTFF